MFTRTGRPPTGTRRTATRSTATRSTGSRRTATTILSGSTAPVAALVTALVTATAAAGCGLDGPGISAEQVAKAPIASGPTGSAVPATPPATPTITPTPTPGPALTPITPTPAQLAMMRSITAVFENDKVAPQYDFIADQKDGCGYTAGWIGFCTKYGDLLDVVEAYNTAKPGDHPLRGYTSTLRRLADDRTDEVAPLGSKFTKAWKDAAADQAFRRVQVEVGQKNYLEPALRIARSKGITTALGLENLFDTALMMGPSATACDGVLKISAQTDKELRGNPASGVPEADWLRRFNQIRVKRLKKPCTPGRQADWPRATGRPEALQELADRGNWALTPPVSIGHGHDLTITEQTIAAELR